MHIRLPHISIIVPCYNSETTIERCVYSILAQTYCNFEIILVDDGSKDRTGDLCNHLALRDNRIRVIHKQNGGVSSARNAGIEIAKGAFITFCDSDDVVQPNWLTTFISIIGNADIAIQGIIFIGKTNKPRSVGTGSGTSNKSLTLKLIENSFLGYSPSKLFKKEIIKTYSIRFNEKIKFREDDVFVLEYIERVKSWTSTAEANYQYFVPGEDKNYGEGSTECTDLVLRSLNNIFDDQIPYPILQKQSWSIKGAIVNKIIKKQPISQELYNAYRIAFANEKGIKRKIANMVILNSHRWCSLSRIILKLINKQ